MLILGIESSCDETAASVVKNGRTVLSSVIASQERIHAKYFGVVPELASRSHLENINGVIDRALKDAGIAHKEAGEKLTAIAYTRGPGLAGSLLVGQTTAQTLAFTYKLPLVDVNHLEGHLYAALLEHKRLAPPYLSLIVSGGHTELVIVNDFGSYTFLGGTRDDAAGEAFDKVAKLLSLKYPGGPVIDALAKKGDPAAVDFPRPVLKGTWDFSFSGLKTAVVNHVRKLYPDARVPARETNDICASFQSAVIDTLITKTVWAAEEYRIKTVVIGGGVSANTSLRRAFLAIGKQKGIKVYLPSLSYCTDNAAMIACAGYYKFQTSAASRRLVKGEALKIEPGMRLENWK